MYEKTVIHVFTNNCYNIKYNPNDTSSYWGIGDLIRGTIKLYQYSQIMKFNYYVDISLHPIARYLINPIHPYHQLVQDNKDNIEFFYIDKLKAAFQKNRDKTQDLESPVHTKSYCTNNTIFMLTTNDRIVETLPITDECKEFILHIFTPKPEFKLYFDNYINNVLKLEHNYGICHFRLGDDFLIKYENKMDNIEKFLNKYITNDCISVVNDILLTDNKLLKKYILDNKIMVTPDTTIKHLGLDDDKTNIDDDYGTRDTLVDFFLVLNSKVIKSYTTYTWISGFVFWLSVVKDIPLIILDK